MSAIARIACLSVALITLTTVHSLGRDLVRQFPISLCVAGAPPTDECPPPKSELRMVQLQNTVSERGQMIQLSTRLVQEQSKCEICKNIR